MFRIKFETKPEEVAAVKSAVRAAGTTTVELTKKAGSVTMSGIDKIRASIHRATAPR